MALDRILFHRHLTLSSLYVVSNLFSAVLSLLVFYSLNATVWELDADGMRRRRLWINTRIRWQDVTRVVSLWSSSFFDLKIEYRRKGFGPRIGHVLVNPADRDQFLDTLRRFAPQAEYIDKSVKKTFDI